MSAISRTGTGAKERLLELWRIRELRLGWLTALAIALALAGALCVKSERAFRLAGLGLQIGGILAVWWNAQDAGKKNKRPGIIAEAIQWWRRVFGIRSPTFFSVDLGVPFSWQGHRPHIWEDANSDASLESRVSILETNLTRTRDRVGQLEQDAAETQKQHDAALDQERRVRSQQDSELREELKFAQVGGLHIAMAGLLCLGVGLVMSTASNELAWLVKSLLP